MRSLLGSWLVGRYIHPARAYYPAHAYLSASLCNERPSYNNLIIICSQYCLDIMDYGNSPVIKCVIIFDAVGFKPFISFVIIQEEEKDLVKWLKPNGVIDSIHLCPELL